MTRFCIVIPTFQSVATLPAAVESALAQAHGDFQVYVSDNGSTDGSADYLRGLSHPRLRVAIAEKCVGKTENWNRAFSTAPEAEFFVMLHSDDVLYPHALETLDAAIQRSPGGALYFANHDGLSVDGQSVRARRGWPFAYRLGGRAFDRLQTLLNAVTVVGTAFRVEAFRRVGGFEGAYDFYQDMELYHQLAHQGDAIYIPRTVGQYRDTPLRPQNRLNFALEEVRWLRSRLDCWPPGISRPVLKLWIARRRAHLAADLPEVADAFTRAVEESGLVCPAPNDDGRLEMWHRLYKAAVSLTSLIFRPRA